MTVPRFAGSTSVSSWYLADGASVGVRVGAGTGIGVAVDSGVGDEAGVGVPVATSLGVGVGGSGASVARGLSTGFLRVKANRLRLPT